MDFVLKYLAKLILNRRVHNDKFPSWRDVMRKNRNETGRDKAHRQSIKRSSAMVTSPTTVVANQCPIQYKKQCETFPLVGALLELKRW